MSRGGNIANSVSQPHRLTIKPGANIQFKLI